MMDESLKELRGGLVRWTGTVKTTRPPEDKNSAWVSVGLPARTIRISDQDISLDGVAFSPSAQGWPAWSALAVGTRVQFECRFEDRNYQDGLGGAVSVLTDSRTREPFVSINLKGGKLVRAETVGAAKPSSAP